MNKYQRLHHAYAKLPITDQLTLYLYANFLNCRHHPRHLALPGTIAGGVLTFSIIIPIAARR